MDGTIIFPNNLFENKNNLDKNSKIFIFQDPLFFSDFKYHVKFNKKVIIGTTGFQKKHWDAIKKA